MCNLVKYIKRLDHHLDDREKLNRVIQFIVEALLLCIAQMQPHSLSKFFTTLAAADDLWSLQA